MGTRHLIAVQQGGEYKIAQYGQWDGYPGGQGVKVLDFASQQENLKRLSNALSRCRFFDAEGRDKEFIEEYERNTPTWGNEQHNRTYEQFRWFNSYISRDLGANILTAVAYSEDPEILLRDSSSFPSEGYGCEYAYVIDFDTRVLEAYEGHGLASGEPNTRFPRLKLMHKWSFDALPERDEFLSTLTPDEESA